MRKKDIDQLVVHEGLRKFPYKCTAGKITIGVGRNLEDNGISEKEYLFIFKVKPKESDLELINLLKVLSKRGLTQEECIYLLKNDMAEAVASLNHHSWFLTLNDDRKAVLVNMFINLGPRGIRKFKKMIECLKEGDFKGASAEMLNSLWATQVGDRAKELAEIMKNSK